MDFFDDDMGWEEFGIALGFGDEMSQEGLPVGNQDDPLTGDDIFRNNNEISEDSTSLSIRESLLPVEYNYEWAEEQIERLAAGKKVRW